MIGIEKSIANEISVNEDCHAEIKENVSCNEEFRPQSMKVFSVVDSSVGIFEDPDTKLTIVDLGSFYGIGGNGMAKLHKKTIEKLKRVFSGAVSENLPECDRNDTGKMIVKEVIMK